MGTPRSRTTLQPPARATPVQVPTSRRSRRAPHATLAVATTTAQYLCSTRHTARDNQHTHTHRYRREREGPQGSGLGPLIP
eukprot:scaffold153799_cov29-Tisochrysis_lutea.AAC.1